jgi:hypothetical protein
MRLEHVAPGRRFDTFGEDDHIQSLAQRDNRLKEYFSLNALDGGSNERLIDL